MNSNNNQHKTCKERKIRTHTLTRSLQTNFYQRTRIISIKKMSQVSKWKRHTASCPDPRLSVHLSLSGQARKTRKERQQGTKWDREREWGRERETLWSWEVAGARAALLFVWCALSFQLAPGPHFVPTPPISCPDRTSSLSSHPCPHSTPAAQATNILMA